MNFDFLFKKWITLNQNRILKKLIDFISINTITPNENNAFNFIDSYMKSINFHVNKQKFLKNIVDHKNFTPYANFDLNNRYNFIAYPSNTKQSNFKTIFNIHLDVVPSNEGFNEAFSPIIKDNYIYGRGVCDTKSNLIMLCEAIRFLQENNIPITKNIEVHIVSEEEISGNGTLSIVLGKVSANEVIVMEPTNLQLYRGHRGCITANIETYGKPVHMGGQLNEVSAIESAIEIISKLKLLETDLQIEAKNDTNFSCCEKAVKVNVGNIVGGEWPGSVPEKCELSCNVGFLPKYSLEDMKKKIKNCCLNTSNLWINKHTRVNFNGLKNSAYINNNVSSLIHCIRKVGINQSNIYGWIVSCDAHLYQNIANIPTYIWGCGSLSDAHSSHEKVSLKELKDEILILSYYLSGK